MSKFTPEVVGRLLNGLARDDAFRAAFERDPRAALSSIGHNTPEQDIGVEGKDPVLPFLQLRGGLASKEKIAASKEQMAAAYNSSEQVGSGRLPFAPFDMCAN